MSSSAGARFSEPSEHNHQAWLWNVSLMSLVFAFLTLGMRMIVKWRMYGHDDVTLGTAYALALGHWIAVFAALRDGVGKDLTLTSASALEEGSQLIYTSRILLLLAVCLSKCTVFLFIRNLFTHETYGTWRACNIFSALTLCWGVASVLIVGVGCPSTHLLSQPARTCASEGTRWTAVVVIDAIIELSIAGLAVYLFAGLHMRFDRKMTVISAFLFRLPTAAVFIIFLTAQLHYLDRIKATATSASLAIVNPLICLEAFLCYALLSATIPCLRGFLGRFRTGDLTHIDDSTGRCGRSAPQATGPSFQFKSLKSLESKLESNSAMAERALFDGHPYGHNAGSVEHTAMASAAMGDDDTRHNSMEEHHSVQSAGSEELFIHRQTFLEVRRD